MTNHLGQVQLVELDKATRQGGRIVSVSQPRHLRFDAVGLGKPRREGQKSGQVVLACHVLVPWEEISASLGRRTRRPSEPRNVRDLKG